MRRPLLRIISLLLALGLFAAVRYVNDTRATTPRPETRPAQQRGTPPSASAPAPEPVPPARTASEQPGSVTDAFATNQSNVWVEGSGTVEAVLRDDNEGARHQKLIVRLSKRQTVLISHNIDIARRAPVDKGDEISFRGEYIWNAKGGIVHWTHHDPNGRKAGGWLRIGSAQYD